MNYKEEIKSFPKISEYNTRFREDMGRQGGFRLVPAVCDMCGHQMIMDVSGPVYTNSSPPTRAVVCPVCKHEDQMAV